MKFSVLPSRFLICIFFAFLATNGWATMTLAQAIAVLQAAETAAYTGANGQEGAAAFEKALLGKDGSVPQVYALAYKGLTAVNSISTNTGQLGDILGGGAFTPNAQSGLGSYYAYASGNLSQSLYGSAAQLTPGGMVSIANFVNPFQALTLQPTDWVFREQLGENDTKEVGGIQDGELSHTGSGMVLVVRDLGNNQASIYYGYEVHSGIGLDIDDAGLQMMLEFPVPIPIPVENKPPIGSLSIDKSMVGQNGTVNLSWSVTPQQ